MLRIEHLTKKYGEKKLWTICLHIEKGEIYFLSAITSW